MSASTSQISEPQSNPLSLHFCRGIQLSLVQHASSVRFAPFQTMKPLKIGITGVRGIVGQTFTPELVVQFAQAFGSYLDGGRILICRDTRPSGPMIRSAVLAGLLASGCEVTDLGVSPTPSMQIADRKSTRLNSSHSQISYAVFCLKKKRTNWA